MRNPTLMMVPFLFVLALFVTAATRLSAADPLDCSKRSLADAVADVRAKDKEALILFTGVCAGPIVVRTDGVTLQGVDTAIIDGGGQDAVTVAGAGRVSLLGVEVRNGANGIVATNGAHVSLKDVNVHDNTVSGISLQTGSSAVLEDVSTSTNGLHGMDVQTGSAARVTGTLIASMNRVFGLNVNSSAITFDQATVTASGNALGIQVSTNAKAFIADSTTRVNVTNNLATGLTVVSGAQLVSFGGTIEASGNPVAGVSVNSKAGLDLDAGSLLNTFNNGTGLLVQHESVMTVFNTPQFSGVPGFSTINARNNTTNGVRITNGSTLILVNQARVLSNQNGAIGFVADNGVGATLLVNSNITGNGVRDIQLTFGTRADFQNFTFGTVTCDLTVLVRGASGITCPQ